MAAKQDNEEKVAEAAVADVQEKMDAATDQGYFGTAADPTPRENYSVDGVTSGAPTPEADADAATEARNARQG